MNHFSRRGGRFSKPRRDNEDPYGDAALDSFIPEPKKREKDPQCIRLHISNIPPTMSEGSLRQLFSDFGNPIIYLSNNIHPSTNKCWGFVDYDSYYEAHNAICALNKSPPHNLYIKFANNAEENSETESFKREILQPKDEDQPSSRGRGRGAHVPLMGRPPNSLRTKPQSFESYCNDPEGDNPTGYSSSKFRHDDTPQHINDTNEVYDSVSKLTRGMKSVSLGRGTYINDKVDKYAYPKPSMKVEEKIEDYMMNKVLKPTREEVRSYPPADNLPFQTGRCPCCDKPSAYICCNCKKWYCSTDCVREHAVKCGTVCNRNSIKFEPKIQTREDNDYILDKKQYERQDSNQRPGNDNLNERSRISDANQHFKVDNFRQSPKTEDINQRMKIQQGGDRRSLEQRDNRGNKNRGNGKNGRSSFSSEEGYTKRDGGNAPNRNGRNSAESHGTFTDNDDDSGRSNNKTRNYRGGDRRSGGGGNDRNSAHRRSKSQSRVSFDNRNNHDNEVYVRKDEMNSSLPHLQRSDIPGNEDDENESGIDDPHKVMVTSVTENDDIYWVCKSSSMADQMELIQTLSSNCKKYKPVSSPSANSTICAPFNDEWYRAKVLSVSGRNVKVLFLDYGNETTVKVDDLKILPLELSSKPPLAFKIRVNGCSRKLEENEEIVINLMNKDASGAWHAKLIENEVKTNVQEVQEEPTISFDHFDLVHIMFGEKGEYYVQLEHNIVKLIKMGDLLGEHKSIKVEPKLGQVYVRNYAGTWCRAKVIKERPLTVFYVDFGNEEEVSKNDLHPVPKQFQQIPGLAIKIKLADGTSNEYLNMKLSSESEKAVAVKAVDQLEDGTLLVHVKGEKYDQVTSNKNDGYPKGVYSDKEREAKHVLGLVKTGETGIWVCVQKAMSTECLSGYIIINTKSPDYCSTSDLSELLKNVEPSHQFTPKVGDLVIARVGTTFCRAYIMMMTNDDVNVALIDYGKVFSVKEKNLTLLPTRFHTYPVRQAVRVILKTPLASEIYRTLIGNKVHLKNLQKSGNSIKCTFGCYNEADIIPWTPFVEEAGLRIIPLNNNSLVTLSSFHTPKSVYVNPANKESSNKFAEFLQDLTRYVAKAESLNRQPLCGEVVCAKYQEDGKYYRAQLYEKAEDGSFKINFVDFGNTEVVSVKDMLPLPDTFKKVPCFAVKVGLKDVAGHNFNPPAMAYLNRLAFSDKVLLLTYDDNLGEVTLAEQDGRIVNNDLRDLMEPSIKSLEMPSSEHLKKLHPFMGTDVIYESWDVNSRINIAILTAETHKTVLAVKENSTLLNHLFTFLAPKMTKYCMETEQRAYNPRANEMILAKYIDDDNVANWCRAICIKSMTSSAFVLFIDYGNCGEFPHSDIRSMPAMFMDTPAALKRCTIYGMVDDISADVKEKIGNLLVNMSTTAIVLEDNEDGNSTLWVPSLYPNVQKLGHPVVVPPPGV